MWADQVPECKNEGKLHSLSYNSRFLYYLIFLLYCCRSRQRFQLPRCRRTCQRWFLLETCSPWGLSQVLHLFGGCCSWIRLPHWHSFQNWRFWWQWQLRRPRGCSRMVSNKANALFRLCLHVMRLIIFSSLTFTNGINGISLNWHTNFHTLSAGFSNQPNVL